MAAEQGTNVLLQISDGTSPTTFVTLTGQQTTTFGGSSTTADTTDKSTSGWRTNITTIKEGTVSVSGVSTWSAQHETIRAAWDARTTVEAKVILDSAGKNYVGNFTIGEYNVEGAYDGATTFSYTLNPAGALVYAAT